jgi:hypothetical protein
MAIKPMVFKRQGHDHHWSRSEVGSEASALKHDNGNHGYLIRNRPRKYHGFYPTYVLLPCLDLRLLGSAPIK